MSFGLLSGKHSIGLARRLNLRFLELLSCSCSANRCSRFVRRDPGIDPLRPGAERSRDQCFYRNRRIQRLRVEIHAEILTNSFSAMLWAIALMNKGGTQLPICWIPSSNSPAKANPSGKEENRLNSGSENRRHSFQNIAPCIPRFPSLRRMVRAGFLGSNFTALKPWPVIGFSDDPRRIRLQCR
jgi:hypothetical protein